MLRDLKRALLAAGMILALSSFALAQYESGRGSNGSRRGYRQGYSDGFQQGRADRDRRAGRNYQNDDYRRGDRGFDNNSGDRNQFIAAYREGYQEGYDDGFSGRPQSADAYDRWRGRDDRGGYGSRGAAYDNGYRDGVDGARADISKNIHPGPNDHGWYRDAVHGYSWRYGNREAYRRQYRQGYEAGYRDTFGQRSPGYGYGRGGDSDRAYSTGYDDGTVGARKDMVDRNSPDPTRHDWYKEANRGYDGRYGNPQDYKQRYRQGYIAGYNDTYRRRW